MKLSNMVRVGALAGGALLGGQACATLACTITAAPTTLSGTYDPATNLDMQGSFTINCTRAKSDKSPQTLWIGLNQTSAQTMAKPAPYADTLAYGIYSDAGHTTLWTNGTTGGFTVSLSFANTSTAASTTVAYYMRANSGQTDKAAGTYNDSVSVSLNLTNSVGQVLGTTAVASQAQVAKSCSVNISAVTIAVGYQAFRSSALVDSSQGISVSCSKGTQVNLSLDKVTGVIAPIGLTYGLTFAAASQSTSAISSTNTAPLSFPLTLSLPAGQAGTCAAATCSGTDIRTVTISY
jgi:spore coat protein U-like protein